MAITEKTNLNSQFTPVDIEQFYDKEELPELNSDFSTNIIVLTDTERKLVNNLFDRLKFISPETLEALTNRITDLEKLASSIARFPSLLQKQVESNETRSVHTLIESLLIQRDGDKMLHLPSKAILGKGFLVTKFQTFSSLTKIAQQINTPADEIARYQNTTLAMMFTLMAEDVYLNLLDNTSLSIDIRRQIAYALIILWEHRSDQNIADMAPVLQSVWDARRKLAPAFGTMVGTSELLLLSIQMDDQWNKFISAKLGDTDISQSMEEFLFGLTFEQIQKLKNILREKGLSAVGRDEVCLFLGKDIKQGARPDTDQRDFYLLYTIRRDNARARKRLDLPGPHNTLEDHYMMFILERNKEKQHNDIYAK